MMLLTNAELRSKIVQGISEQLSVHSFMKEYERRLKLKKEYSEK